MQFDIESGQLQTAHDNLSLIFLFPFLTIDFDFLLKKVLVVLFRSTLRHCFIREYKYANQSLETLVFRGNSIFNQFLLRHLM